MGTYVLDIETDDWVKDYQKRSRSQMKATYPTFRERYNDTMNRLTARKANP